MVEADIHFRPLHTFMLDIYKEMWHAGQPPLPLPSAVERVPGWGGERTTQEAAVTAAWALHQQFTIHSNVLERVEVYKYLGWMMAQDDDDAQAIRAQLRKARATWARVGKVLRGENTSPTVAAKFYLAVVQAVLLYISETWVIFPQAMAQLEGFHIRAVWRMAQRHKPRWGPRKEWIYPKSEDVLKECRMKMIAEYIQIHRQTMTVYVVIRPILQEFRQGEQQRGVVPHR
jgi:hypothetical protein